MKSILRIYPGSEPVTAEHKALIEDLMKRHGWNGNPYRLAKNHDIPGHPHLAEFTTRDQGSEVRDQGR